MLYINCNHTLGELFASYLKKDVMMKTSAGKNTFLLFSCFVSESTKPCSGLCGCESRNYVLMFDDK